MPLTDFGHDELVGYRPVSTAPHDFDAFWQHTLDDFPVKSCVSRGSQPACQPPGGYLGRAPHGLRGMSAGLDAGLIVSHRHAASVPHTLTPVGAALLRANTPAGPR
ncbi:acetylxylan esterase [Streptomyces sp. NPDC007991]|uniref:acetylxylan esterase n=1 Tax=Streptomyces sp. NPDC007991 TaxID=3364803 RepID=UPI0036E2234E